jgi:hypothetical protein
MKGRAREVLPFIFDKCQFISSLSFEGEDEPGIVKAQPHMTSPSEEIEALQ